MRASLLQIDVNEDESVESRRVRVASLVREQAGADLVVLPELWTTGAFAYEGFGTEAEPLEGPTYEAMAKAASDAGVWLHAGSVPERDPDGPLYNTSLVFSPSGDLAAAYRKIHRFGFDKGEAVLMGAGRDLVTVRLPDTTLGLRVDRVRRGETRTDARGRFSISLSEPLAAGAHELDASHNPHVTVPEELAALLDRIARN